MRAGHSLNRNWSFSLLCKTVLIQWFSSSKYCTISYCTDEDTRALAKEQIWSGYRLWTSLTVLKELAWVTAKCLPWLPAYLPHLKLYVQYEGGVQLLGRRDTRGWEHGDTLAPEIRKEATPADCQWPKEGRRAVDRADSSYLLHARVPTLSLTWTSTHAIKAINLRVIIAQYIPPHS